MGIKPLAFVRVVVTVLASAFLILVMVTATGSVTRAKPGHRSQSTSAVGQVAVTERVGASGLQPRLLPLDFTPVATGYLPIVFSTGGPGAANPQCNPTNGSGGLEPGLYITTVAGLNASVVVGEGYDPQTPTYLGFHAHGDNGNWEKFGTKATNEVTEFVNQRGWIFVAPEAPNDGKSWWNDWNGDHVEAFAAVLDEMFAQYNLCRDIVFGSSGSGGSEFYTRLFFPRKGGEYPAHSLISCGGNDAHGADRDNVFALGQDADVVARSTFYFLYGSEDSLVPLIENSIEMYTDAGFNVQVEVLEGAGHCNDWKDQGLPKQSPQIAAHWADFAATLGIE